MKTEDFILEEDVLICPTEDWFCPYYDDEFCTLKNAKEECDAFYGLEEEED